MTYRSSGRQSFCHPYHNKRTDTDVEGCGKEVKWVEEDTQWGKKNKKVNMDGSKHVCPGGKKMPGRTEDMMPEEYRQLTGPTQAAQGHTEAKSNSMMYEFIDKKSDEFLNRVEEKVTKLVDNAQSKSASNNVTLATLGKEISENGLSLRELRDEFKLLHEKVDAALATVSFQGADKLYEKQTGVRHTTTLSEGKEEVMGEEEVV